MGENMGVIAVYLVIIVIIISVYAIIHFKKK